MDRPDDFAYSPDPSVTEYEAMLRSMRTQLRTTRSRELNNLPISVLSETSATAIELNQLTGRGSERGKEDRKLCDRVSEEKKADVKKSSGCDRNYFDCNICLDLSKEPVLTCCGHLYCWPCLYAWLQFSGAKECPVCKGVVTPETVTPIYGGGNHQRERKDTKKIPMRPQARRIENLRNTTHRQHSQPNPAAAAMLAALRRNENGSRVSRPSMIEYYDIDDLGR